MISDTETLLAMYEQMLLIRRTEKAAHDLFMAGLVKGTTHLAAGHEAVAVGAIEGEVDLVADVARRQAVQRDAGDVAEQVVVEVRVARGGGGDGLEHAALVVVLDGVEFGGHPHSIGVTRGALERPWRRRRVQIARRRRLRQSRSSTRIE